MQNRIIAGLISTLLIGMLTACGGGGVGAEANTQVLSSGASTGQTLNPGRPPGVNFKLAPFTLQLPTGSSGNVDTVSGSSLAAGYTNQYYFYTDSSDGALVMVDPTQGWTTSGSQHPRTEMRENATWSTNGINKLDATVAVTQVPSKTTVGQIFQGSGPSKPLCELQVTAGGAVNLLLESTNQGGNAQTYPITSITAGSRFNYELSLTGTTITVTVNGTVNGTVKTFTMDSSFNGENFYFKAGNYDQSAVSGTPLTTPGTIVKFYALTLTH